MIDINKNFTQLSEDYLFRNIALKVAKFREENPNKKIIKMGIGDVSLPITKNIVKSFHKAIDDMSKKETFKGYGNEQGYDFLRENIKKYYQNRNVILDIDEIFISDGAKSDLGNILDIFDNNINVTISNPVYPAYVDANIINGNKINFINGDISNNFLPTLDDKCKESLVYICSPNNPTGAVYDKDSLKNIVDFANRNNCIIIFDSAYEIFIEDQNLPHSIFEIDGAKNCAIEICSFSKSAGFTGVRCGYTIIPKEVKLNKISLNKLWFRRQSTKFNGVSYITQVGANEFFSEASQKEIVNIVKYYKRNSKLIFDTLTKLNILCYGGVNSPYVWLKTPNKESSWEYFDLLLEGLGIVGTPGVGFGKNGEGYFRLTGFSSYEDTILAMNKFEEFYKK
ncbi:MAG: LL-diaminopimelate aminotransferase [Clostridia bacterium]|nr:LL-diaminopimelate aminotransferase [Clostridia bacterium]